MTKLTPEEAAKLAAAATEGPLTQIEQLRLHIECDLSPPCLDSVLDEIDAMEAAAHDMADLIARMDEALKAVEALGVYATLIGEKHECPWHMLSDDFGEKARAALAELGDRDMCKNFTELREGEG